MSEIFNKLSGMSSLWYLGMFWIICAMLVGGGTIAMLYIVLANICLVGSYLDQRLTDLEKHKEQSQPNKES